MQHAPDQRQYRPDSIAWLSGELREEVRFVDDPELRSRIYDWLREVAELPGGEVLEIVDHRLTTLRQREEESHGMAEFEMRRVDGGGEEEFPDSCQGCDHYGTRCPVFVDPVERDRREQLQEANADADSAQKRRAYRRYAESVGCHQITSAIADHAGEHQSLRKRGLDLIEATDVDIGFTGEEDEAARLEAKAEQEGR